MERHQTRPTGDTWNIDAHLSPGFDDDIKPRRKSDYRDVINLSSNELRDPTVEVMFEDFWRTGRTGPLFMYPFHHPAEAAVAEQFGVAPEQAALTAGSDDAIKLIMHSLTAVTRRMVLQTPNYENYELYGRLNHVEIRRVDWYFDEDAFVAQFIACLEQTPPSLAVLTTPNGWTGRILSFKAVRRIAGVCARHDHLLCLDQAYAAFTSENCIPLLQEFPNVLLVWSFSKALGLAGFRLGAVLGAERVIAYLQKWRPSNALNRLGLEFLVYCLQNRVAVRAMQSGVIRRRAELCRCLQELFPQWTVPDTHTNFLLVETGAAHTKERLAQLLALDRIIVRAFTGYPLLDGCIRMTVPGEHEMGEVMASLRRFADQ